LGEYPKHPDKFHHRKRFLIPKTYLFKLRVVQGFTVKEIAAWHQSELGVKISERTVKYYLTKFKIFRPEEPKTKKKYKRPPFNKAESLHYLQKCFRILQSPFKYLDNLNHQKRKRLIGKFFIQVAKKGLWTQDQGEWLRRLLRRYEVAPRTADLLFPKRYVILDWRKINKLRFDSGVSIYEFCKIIGIPRRKYTVAFNKGYIRMSRLYAIRMKDHFNFPTTQFSEEIK